MIKSALLSLCILAATASCRDKPTAPAAKIAHAVPAVSPRSDGVDAIEYTLGFPEPETHYIEVTAVFPAADTESLDLAMATWTPGSYLVREYSRNLEEMIASTTTGAPLSLVKQSKNHWRITTKGAAKVVLRYRVYAREMSVRTNFVDSSIAIINGAPTFVTTADDLSGKTHHSHDVLLEPRDGWTPATAMPLAPDGKANHLRAPNFDTLVDSPIVLGAPDVRSVEVEGVKHDIATFEGGDVWDHKRVATDMEQLIRAQIEFWRVVPYQRYLFLNVLTGRRNGLEHRASTLVTASRWMTRKRSDYVGWLGLMSHEFFHTWNGKRLRPLVLGPFDYEHESYTRSLWVVEGITSYYDDLLLRRAGLISHKEYLERITAAIESVQDTPGRKVQPLAASSFDAWIKYYRHDENSNNSSVSYYVKGTLVGFLLDAEIRKRTSGARSLDDVMRLAYKRYAADTGYTPVQFRQTAEEIAGSSLQEFWSRFVDGTDELDYAPALTYFGLRFKSSAPDANNTNSEDNEDNEAPPGWLGLTAKLTTGRLLVAEVKRDTPAQAAGINVGDELIAIDGYRWPAGGLDARLAHYRPGDKVVVTVARRELIVQLDATLGRKPKEQWKLEIAGATLAGSSRRNAWLGADTGL